MNGRASTSQALRHGIARFVGLAIIIASCASTRSAEPVSTYASAQPPASTTSVPDPTSTLLPDTTSLAATSSTLPTRECETNIGLDNIDMATPQALEAAAQVGPVVFWNVALAREMDEETEWGPDADNRHPALKVPVTVVAGKTATVRISPNSRSWSSLIYVDVRPAGRFQLTEGTEIVLFIACDKEDTSFNGGFIVASPGCLELIVEHDNQEHQMEIPIAIPEC